MENFVTNINDIPVGVIYIDAIYRPDADSDLVKGWIPAPVEKTTKK